MSFTATVAATRRPKRLYPPAPPTPKILHLPRRPRRRTPKSGVGAVHGKPAPPSWVEDKKGKLVALFDQERVFSKDGSPIVLVESERRRERVCEEEEEGRGADVEVAEEEKWRFQAEMLRAECNLLRMEKEIVVKKMERISVKMERTLNSAVHTLVSGRKKISEGRNATMVLEEEIQQLVQKLEKLQRNLGAKGMKVRKSNNLDKQAYLLQRRLEKFRGTSDEICVKEIQEMAEASLSVNRSYSGPDENLVSSGKSHTMQAEILRRRMDGLSNGMLLKRMKEEYGSMLSTANNSVASSASSSKRIESTDLSSSLEKESHDEKVCSGRCKTIIRRIVEQVRAETEQWSQMQEMLCQVKEEMDELQASRDFWEDQALDSDYHIQSLTSSVQEWRQKAVSSESKARELQEQVSLLHAELNSLRKYEKAKVKENHSPNIRDPQKETDKRVLLCHLMEKHCTKEYSSKQRQVLLESRKKPDSCTNRTTTAPHALKRSPFQDIGNSSLSSRKHSRAVFPLHCPLPSTT